MLILSRKQGESIILGEDIFIKVLETGGEPSNQVKIAIDAPEDLNIVRTEILLNRRELREKIAGMSSPKVSKRIRKEIRKLETSDETTTEETA